MHESAIEMKKFIDNIPNDDYKPLIIKNFHKRCAYSLLAAVMSTYFHPNNPYSYAEKKRKFKEAMKDFYLFREAIKNVKLSEFDKKRQVAVFSIKYNLYFMLIIIAKVKRYMDSKGKYGY